MSGGGDSPPRPVPPRGLGRRAVLAPPVAERLPAAWSKAFLDWPGLGRVPPRVDVNGFDDLARLVLERAGTGPVDLVAQSMGGVVATMVVLARPDVVARLVLTATSGGLDLEPFAPADWREDYGRELPDAAPWIREERPDLSARLPLVTAPTLLRWSDPISRSEWAGAWPSCSRAPSWS